MTFRGPLLLPPCPPLPPSLPPPAASRSACRGRGGAAAAECPNVIESISMDLVRSPSGRLCQFGCSIRYKCLSERRISDRPLTAGDARNVPSSSFVARIRSVFSGAMTVVLPLWLSM